MALAQRGIRENVTLHVVSHNADLDPAAQPWRQVQDVIDGKLDVAAVWGPFAGWLKTTKKEPLVVQPVNLDEDDVPLEFDLAIGLRKIDWILKYKFDLALNAKRTEIERILRDYGVPLVQCSRCIVAGDLPSHGTYTRPIDDPRAAYAKAAPDQKVDRARLEDWLKSGADINQELVNAVLAGDAYHSSSTRARTSTRPTLRDTRRFMLPPEMKMPRRSKRSSHARPISTSRIAMATRPCNMRCYGIHQQRYGRSPETAPIWSCERLRV